MRMLLNNLQSSLPHTVINENVPLSPLCTLGVGGEAEFFAAPSSIGQMHILFNLAMKENCPVYVLGGGSNVLFPDGLVKGIVISTQNLNSIEWRTPITADIDAGFKLPALMKELRERGLAGMEFAAGIPGTLGGAIAGNAGAGGHGVCELVDQVITIEADGTIKMRNNNDISYSYRKCSLSEGKRVIVSARMTFRTAAPKDADVLDSYLLRRGTQPHGLRNAGCTFKNPEGNSAGKLLDEAGCKGLCVGDAIVSDVHANFILNRGHAASSDIMELVKMCSQRVYDSTGIRLEPEIKFLGWSDPCFCV
ncbi:MAG: UDP-N-acetylmuramate dehydrogenase [Synergistaceae bacterium]|nr:UDP-N-acetylmuramate dehydrogenase [Synergistaceae bacterium]